MKRRRQPIGHTIIQTVGLIASIVLLCMLARPSHAQPTSVGLHMASVHDQPGFNNSNPGLYVMHQDAAGNGPVIGAYYNSERHDSFYVAYTWRLAGNGRCSLDLAGGAITGYDIAPLAPLLVPSAACAVVGGISARLSFVPLIKRDGAAVLHLSLEYAL